MGDNQKGDKERIEELARVLKTHGLAASWEDARAKAESMISEKGHAEENKSEPIEKVEEREIKEEAEEEVIEEPEDNGKDLETANNEETTQANAVSEEMNSSPSPDSPEYDITKENKTVNELMGEEPQAEPVEDSHNEEPRISGEFSEGSGEEKEEEEDKINAEEEDYINEKAYSEGDDEFVIKEKEEQLNTAPKEEEKEENTAPPESEIEEKQEEEDKKEENKIDLTDIFDFSNH